MEFKHLKLYQIFIKALALLVFIGFFTLTARASDRFSNNNEGTVTDAKTGLMWAAKDNVIPISWPDARSYCRDYRGGGFADWRLPTLAELTSLFDPEFKNERGYHVPNLLDTSAQSLWASETRGLEAARFNFTYGQVYWLRQNYSGPTRVLPVRRGR